MEAGGGLVRLLRTRGETDWLLREVDPVLRILGWENARVVTAQTFFERLLGLLAPAYRAGMRARRGCHCLPMLFFDTHMVHEAGPRYRLSGSQGCHAACLLGREAGRLVFCSGASLAIERVSTKEFPGQD